MRTDAAISGLNPSKGDQRKKIAFVKFGSFSHINDAVGEQLVRCFPDFDVEVIDVRALIAGNKKFIFRNCLEVAAAFPRDLLTLTRRRTFRDEFYRTGYILKKIHEYVAERVKPNLDQYAFTFQTQSMFDGAVEGIPNFIYTDHTNLANMYYPVFGEAKLFSKRWHKLEENIYRKATRLFTMSNHVRQSLIEHYHCAPEKVVCALAGPNAEIEFGPLLNNNYRNKNILFVGAEWERKGGPLLVEAFKRVLKKHPDARLTIVGVSPQIDVSNCDIVGRVPRDQVHSYFRKAAIFCLPTRVEPFGVVFVESMFYKIPVVAPKIGALPDLIEDEKNGRLVQPNDVNSLTDALIALLDDPEKCRQFGEKSLEVVKGRYTWDAVGTRFKENIMGVLGSGTERRDC
jgi:glycosyltransferase involved in cell wall biosynthesis